MPRVGQGKKSEVQEAVRRIQQRAQNQTTTSNETTLKSPGSTVTQPPKAAIASNPSDKIVKSDVLRRKKSMRDFIRPSASTSSSAAAPTITTTASTNAHATKRPISPPALIAHALPHPHDAAISNGSHHLPQNSEENIYKQQILSLETALSAAHSEQARMRSDMDSLRQSLETMTHAAQVRRQSIQSLPAVSAGRRSVDSSVTSSGPHSAYPRDGPPRVPDAWLEDNERGRAGEEYEEERAAMEEQLQELQAKMHLLQTDMLDRDNYWKSQWERETRERAYERNSLAEDLHTAQKEALDRRKQLLDLKQSISSLTHIENQVTDGELAERMDGLYNKCREWIVSNFRKSTPELRNLRASLSSAELKHLLPRHAEIDPKVHKINVYQAIMTSTLMDIFEDDVCFGLPHEGLLSQIRSIAAHLSAPLPEYRKWHSATVELVLKTLETPLTKETGNQLTKLSDQLLTRLRAISGLDVPTASRNTLDSILKEAVQISRLFRVQVPLYTISLPQDEYFDDTIMQLTEEQDDDDDEHVRVALTMSPCVEKISKDVGEQGELRHTINKARVILFVD